MQQVSLFAWDCRVNGEMDCFLLFTMQTPALAQGSGWKSEAAAMRGWTALFGVCCGL